MNKLKALVAAAAVSVVAFAAAPASAMGVNLLQNGSFEDMTGIDPLGNPDWGVYQNIPGWESFTGTGIEIQRGNIGGSTAQEGLNKVELDSDPNRGGDGQATTTNSDMQQSVALTAGQYKFSFWYRGRTNNLGTNGIDFVLTNTTVGPDFVTGIASDGWTLIERTFTLAADASVNVIFEATGTADRLGGYIDNVQLTAVPLPPAVALFGAALAGLGFLGRRRRKSA